MNQLFRSPEYIINDLTQAILDGAVNDKVYCQAKEKAEAIIAQKAKDRAEALEQRRLKLIEDRKPCNAIPYFERNKGGAPNMLEYREYLKTYDLEALETYLNELVNGEHKGEVMNIPEVIQTLSMYITARINAANPNFQAKEAITRAKDEIKTAKNEMDVKEKKVLEIHENTKKLAAKIDANSPVRAKAYTT